MDFLQFLYTGAGPAKTGTPPVRAGSEVSFLPDQSVNARALIAVAVDVVVAHEPADSGGVHAGENLGSATGSTTIGGLDREHPLNHPVMVPEHNGSVVVLTSRDALALRRVEATGVPTNILRHFCFSPDAFPVCHP